MDWMTPEQFDRRLEVHQHDFRDVIIAYDDLSSPRHVVNAGHLMRRSDFTGATLSQLDLASVNLTQARMPCARLINIDLAGADLSDALLSDTELHRVSLRGADLRGADLSWTRWSSVDLTDALLDGASLKGSVYDDDVIWPRGFDAIRATHVERRKRKPRSQHHHDPQQADRRSAPVMPDLTLPTGSALHKEARWRLHTTLHHSTQARPSGWFESMMRMIDDWFTSDDLDAPLAEQELPVLTLDADAIHLIDTDWSRSTITWAQPFHVDLSVYPLPNEALELNLTLRQSIQGSPGQSLSCKTQWLQRDTSTKVPIQHIDAMFLPTHHFKTLWPLLCAHHSGHHPSARRRMLRVH